MLREEQKRQEYQEKLKKLVILINTNVIALETQQLFEEANGWDCFRIEERILLEKLLQKAKEYSDFENKKVGKEYTEDERIQSSDYTNLFTGIYMDLKEYNKPLYESPSIKNIL